MSGLSAKQVRAISRVLREHRIVRAFIFGSRVASGFRDDSDVDLVVDFGRPRNLLALVGLKQDLEKAVGLTFDVIEIETVNVSELESASLPIAV